MKTQPQPGTVEYYARFIASQLSGYVEPVPPGRLSVAERDQVALELGARWKAKVDAGGSSCAWHEISMWARERGSKHPCPCSDCSPHIRRFA